MDIGASRSPCDGIRGDGARLKVSIHEALVPAHHSREQQRRIFAMNVSSIAASAPVKAPEASEPKAPEVQADGDADKVGASQPTVLAALPPGQGTRINQIA
jgi:hypothetical protein